MADSLLPTPSSSTSFPLQQKAHQRQLDVIIPCDDNGKKLKILLRALRGTRLAMRTIVYEVNIKGIRELPQRRQATQITQEASRLCGLDSFVVSSVAAP